MTLRAAAVPFTTAEAVRATSDCGCITADDPTDEALEVLIDTASDELCRLSWGRVYGRQETTVRPCRTGCWDTCGCGCTLDGVPLWGPDPDVSVVKINGAVLATNLYGIHESIAGYHLVRLSINGIRPPSWPSWQELWRPDTENHTFSIKYEYGVHIDRVIERAAIELVCYYSRQEDVKKNLLGKGTVSANYNATTVTLEERRLTQRGNANADTESVGPRMSEFLTIWGGPRSHLWAPELDGGWTMHVVRSA